MATAAPSPLASSVEKTNGHKLSRLLIDGGTKVLRNHFDHHHPPANLAGDLHTNLSILRGLRSRRILNDSQWNKLFPPGGAQPDPNTFDITLLFLLLTNICGLSPPLSGCWHKMPPASDTTLAANLARIKCYRNELYGHVTTTGIQTPVFNVQWQEVSSVLVSLGLSQSEVDRLKREPCGEDYVRAVTEWMKSDEEIRLQLNDLQQKQDQALQSQQDDHRTLQDTQQTVSNVQQMQMEASKLQKEDHRTLQDTHQTVSKVRQLQIEASKLQQEDHRTLQHTQQTVSKVQQVQLEASKLQHEDHETLQDIHQAVEDVRQTVQNTPGQRIPQEQIGNEVLKAEERRGKDKEGEALRKLAKLNTEREILYHSKKYQEGTRISFFQNIKLWLEDPNSGNRVMVISGDAGMGKSVIAAVVCQRMQQAGCLSGSHFCQHSKTRFRNPKVMLQSLACQLCEVLPQYKKDIVQALSRNLGVDINNLEVGELFELLFKEPLRDVDDPGKLLLMVIDGLDESEYKGRNELLDVIANHFCTLPVWLRFLVTTRPEINIADHLRKFNPLQLEQNDEENVKDIRLFLETQLRNVIQSGCEEIIINELVRKAAGHILYAYLMVDFIKTNFLILAPDELSTTLPSGVSSVYQSYFERLEKELQIGEEQFFTFLSALAAAREPLPIDFFSAKWLWDTKSLAGRRKVREAIRTISTLLPVRDGRIHFFHKSVKDWFTDESAYGEHNFNVDEKQGHLILSQLCTDELNGVKEKDVHSSDFSDTAKYALQHGVYHMLESEDGSKASSTFQEIVKNYVIDFEIVYAKLCVNDTASSEDIVRVRKQELFGALSSEIRGALGTLLFLLRKYHEILSTRPSVFFQVMVNRGGDVFCAKATELLETKYHQIPYMRYVDQMAEEEEMTGTQAVFRCMSRVTCFDISPNMEFMVCECMDGSIQLWSLQTGKLLWKRPVKVEKSYVDDYGTLRVVSNSSVFSCYRSVVFHPTEPIVLPGILSHAYSIDGELLPLFPKSNCRFVVCSTWGDSMITDSSDDAKCLVMWNLKNGDEISRTIRNEIVLSFAWSPDGRLLAISHSPGLVCLVDVLNCFQTLAEATTFKPCGMIRFTSNPFIEFSRDMKSLFCRHTPKDNIGLTKDIYLNFIKSETPDGTVHWLSYPAPDFGVSEKYDLPSKGGFLMGDLHSSVDRTFVFVLNEQSVVRVLSLNDSIEIVSPLKLNIKKSILYRESLFHVAFALDGKTIYGVTDGNEETIYGVTRKIEKIIYGVTRRNEEIIYGVTCRNEETIYGVTRGIGRAVLSFNASSRYLKYLVTSGNRNIPRLPCTTANSFHNVSLVPVTKGVVLTHRNGGWGVQLWNFELSEKVRSWPGLSEVTYIMPFSDQCVACVGRGFEVSILDTSSGDIVKTIPLSHEGYKSTHPFLYKEAIVCNKKYLLLSTDRDSLQLSDGKSMLWRRLWKNSLLNDKGNLSGMFSPKEEYVLISVTMALESQLGLEVHVLDATSGHTLRTLCTVDEIYDCAFVSNTEYVISCRSILLGYCLQLFNVRSGDLLSFLDMVPFSSRLASFPPKGLIAIGLCDPSGSRVHPLIEVKLRRDKDKGKDSQSSTHEDRECSVVQRPLGSYFKRPKLMMDE